MSENPFQSPSEPPPPENPPRDYGLAGLTSFTLGVLWFGVDVALFFLGLAVDPGLILDTHMMLFWVFGMPALMVAIMVGVRGKSRSGSPLGVFTMLAFAIALGLGNGWIILQLAAAC